MYKIGNKIYAVNDSIIDINSAKFTFDHPVQIYTDNSSEFHFAITELSEEIKASSSHYLVRHSGSVKVYSFERNRFTKSIEIISEIQKHLQVEHPSKIIRFNAIFIDNDKIIAQYGGCNYYIENVPIIINDLSPKRNYGVVEWSFALTNKSLLKHN